VKGQAGLPLLGVGGRAASGCSQATTFLGRLTTSNGTAYTNTICALVSGGYITGTLSGAAACGSLFDVIYFLNSDTSANSLLNICGTSYGGTAHGSPAFTAGSGFLGVDSSATVYIDTGYAPATAGGNMALSSAHVSAWSFTNATSGAGGGEITGLNDTTNGIIGIFPRYNDGNYYGRMNASQASQPAAIANANSSGWYVEDRPNSTTENQYRNGSSFATPSSNVASAMSGENIYILAGNSLAGATFGGGYQIGLFTSGASLSSGQVTGIYNIFCNYWMMSVRGSC
jgi:hypothetical protein